MIRTWGPIATVITLSVGTAKGQTAWCPQLLPAECAVLDAETRAKRDQEGSRKLKALLQSEQALESKLERILEVMSSDCLPPRNLVVLAELVGQEDPNSCSYAADAGAALLCSQSACLHQGATKEMKDACARAASAVHSLRKRCASKTEPQLGFIEVAVAPAPMVRVSLAGRGPAVSEASRLGPGVHWRHAGAYALRFEGTDLTPACTVDGVDVGVTKNEFGWELPFDLGPGQHQRYECRLLVPVCFDDPGDLVFSQHKGEWRDQCLLLPPGGIVSVATRLLDASQCGVSECRYVDGEGSEKQIASSAGACTFEATSPAGYRNVRVSVQPCAKPPELAPPVAPLKPLPKVAENSAWPWVIAGSGVTTAGLSVGAFLVASKYNARIRDACGSEMACDPSNLRTDSVLDYKQQRNTWGWVAITSGLAGTALLGVGGYALWDMFSQDPGGVEQASATQVKVTATPEHLAADLRIAF